MIILFILTLKIINLLRLKMREKIKFYLFILIIILIPFSIINYSNKSNYEKELLINKERCDKVNADNYILLNVSDSVFEKQTFNYAKGNKLIQTNIPC